MRADFDMSDVNGLADALEVQERTLPFRAETLVRAETAHGMGLSIANAPYLTGALRASHTMDVNGGGEVITGEFGPEIHYARFVHDGTSRMAPRPYLGRAMDVIEDQFPDRVRILIDDLGPG